MKILLILEDNEVPLANLREWLNIKTIEGALVDSKVFAGLWLTGGQ